MKRMMMLFSAMLASLVVLADTWVDPLTGIEWTYTVDNGEVSIGGGSWKATAVKKSFVGDVQIPASVNSYRVTSIGLDAFSDCDKLTSVTIPNGVTTIGFGAFLGCDALTNVVISASVTNIGYEAFAYCSALEVITVDAENQNYKSITGLLLTRDGRTLVAGVNGDVIIPNGVTEIADYAFSDRYGLTQVTIPSSVKNIGKDAFYYCIGLTDVTLPESVTSIGGRAFQESGLLRVSIPASVEHIDSMAFSYCNGLMHVTFCGEQPYSEYAFSYCDNLHEIFVPSNKGSWDDVDLWEEKKVVHYYPAGGEVRAVADGSRLVFSGDGVMADCPVAGALWMSNANAFISICIGAGVTRIGANVFAGMEKVGYVTIPASVTSIGDGAFSQCSSLTNVTFLGDAPDTGDSIYEGTPRRLVSYVDNSSIGWAGGVSTDLPESWNERAIRYIGSEGCVPTNCVWFTNTVVSTVYETNTVTETLYQTNTVEKTETVFVTNVIEQVHEVEVEKIVTIFATNYIDVVVTNYVGLCDGEIGKVSDEVMAFEPSSGFDGSQKRTLNGIVFDDDGVFCGLAQIATAKATSRGVTVSGFVMLSDGKKQSLRSVRGAIEGGLLEIKTKVGKIDEIDLVIGANGFRGQIGELTVVSANPDDESGVLRGSMLLYYFDPKTARLKTKSIKVSGVALEGDASGIIDVRGKEPKSFAAEIE